MDFFIYYLLYLISTIIVSYIWSYISKTSKSGYIWNFFTPMLLLLTSMTVKGALEYFMSKVIYKDSKEFAETNLGKYFAHIYRFVIYAPPIMSYSIFLQKIQIPGYMHEICEVKKPLMDIPKFVAIFKKEYLTKAEKAYYDDWLEKLGKKECRPRNRLWVLLFTLW